MKKVIVLNSGGFDSVVLMHLVHDMLGEECEIHSIHFSYRQNNFAQELVSSVEVAEKMNCVIHNVRLPMISWTKSNFFNPEFESAESQYLEYRNLIFLSYAMSLAESIGAEAIYLAILKSHHEYTDTSLAFIDHVNKMAKELSNIEILTPFIEMDKTDLGNFVYKYNIQPGEYFSCDTPVNGEPCGECPDCKELAEIEKYDCVETPIKAFIQTFDPDSDRFKKAVMDTGIKEVRLLLNNQCQIKCPHCFYGFEDTKLPVLQKEVLMNAVREAIDLGINNIHFSGKEPLFNEDIFWYAEQIRNYCKDTTFDVVTNGINVPKYAHQLKEHGFERVCLSADEFQGIHSLRKTGEVLHNAIKALREWSIPIDIFIDIHEDNWRFIDSIINNYRYNYGITNFYVRTIRRIGGAKDFKSLELYKLNRVFEELKAMENIHIDFNIGLEYTYKLLESTYELGDAINTVLEFGNPTVTDSLHMIPQAFCGKYNNQITITPDGYVLGCASEVSSPNYDKLSAGNVLDSSLKDIIKAGKEKCIKCNTNYMDTHETAFENCPHIFEESY